MNISKTELKRIAELCMLDFTDDELEILLHSIQTTIEESKQLFDFSHGHDPKDFCDSPNEAAILEYARKSFAICVPNSEKASG